MNYNKFLGAASAALMIVIVIFMLTPGAWAQSKYKTLYKFKGGKDGWRPEASLIFDPAGNLYGTTEAGGANQRGTVFKLTPNGDGSWTENVLYSFCSLTNCTDGALPVAGLTFDGAGNLYGMTGSGGPYFGGVVFKLVPHADGSWTERVLYSFCSLTNCSDGFYPQGGLIFDQAGNLYGTVEDGGNRSDCDGNGCGVVFQLTPNSDGSWKEKVIHSFTGEDGGDPEDTLIFDQAGNLYGTTYLPGAVFQLTPTSDGSWSEKVLHIEGGYPYGSVIFDQAGNLYGTTLYGGLHGLGAVFELTPSQGGTWKENVLYSFTADKGGQLPFAGLTFDLAGNLYGTTWQGGNHSFCAGKGCGVVFTLTPGSKGGWTETVLHTFLDRPGAAPFAGVIFDAAGNLYGTTVGDGKKTFGSVYEITP